MLTFIKDLKYLALNHIKEDKDKKAFEKGLQNLRTKEAKNTLIWLENTKNMKIS